MRTNTVLSATALLAVAAFGFAHVHPFGNPRKLAPEPRQSLLRNANISDGVRDVLVNKCADCHSNTTRWPIYTRVAPVSWLIERDVMGARKHLDLSRWSALTADQREVLSTEIVNEAKKGAMPPPKYQLIHRGSKLSREDILTLLALTPDAAITDNAIEGDAIRGRALFGKRCTGCHSIEASREGPLLRGVYGRKAGAIHDFAYSSALQRSGLTWTDVSLNRWLRDSDEMVEQSAMGFSVPKAQDRADLIAFLKQQI